MSSLYILEDGSKISIKSLEKLPLKDYNDSIRIYRLKEVSEVYTIGLIKETTQDDVIFF